ncbi:MAG: sigma-70 family RNA polymerase sigma factor [Pontiellaceae bacterium]|nr:sigma-70 family RNA polymerase sigma factor [Pontiellaceae bacterium]MBN2786444.1 sigma-70 family RNA polymerase sigma factor [Pontiellaceae bacterium]
MRHIFKQIELLYQTEGASLLRYIRRSGGGGAAEDLLQETFVQLIEKPEGLRGARSPKAWVYGVARHLVLGFIQKESRELPLEAGLSEGPAVVRDERIPLLKAAIRKLPRPQQEVLELRLDAEMSYQEIAETLGVPVGTVRSRLHHAVRSLRSALEGKEKGHG